MENQAFKAENTDSANVDFQKNEKEVTDNELLSENGTDILQSLKNENQNSWEEELKGNNVDFTAMPKQDYLNFCYHTDKSLQSLLADEMTNFYANFSLLFKKFRLTYIHNQKLLKKIFELEGEKRALENNNREFLEKLDKNDEKEKELRDSYVAIRNAMAETVKQKNDITNERDELKQTLLQIPDEIIKAAGEYSLVTATEENNRLKSEILELKDQMIFIEEDLKHSQKREEMFRNKYQEAKAVRSALQEEIVAVKREVVLQAQMRENEQSIISDKKDEIRKNFMTIKKLKEDITNLSEDVKREKDLHRRIYKEMVANKIAVLESERTIKQMRNEFNARQFQVTVLSLRKKKLEDDVQKSLTEIHAQKVENAKISKERNAFARNVQILEEDVKKIKDDLEIECHKNRMLTGEIEDLQKNIKEIENEKKVAKSQKRKAEVQLRDLKKESKYLRTEVDMLKQHKEAALKEIGTKSRQLIAIENLLARNREEKDNLIREMTELKSTIADLQELTKALKQKCDGYDAKILQLNEKIQDKNQQYNFLKDMHRETVIQHNCVKQELEQTQHLNTLITQRIGTQTGQINNLQEQKIKMEKQIVQLKMDIMSVRSTQTQQEAQCKELSAKLSLQEKEKFVILKSKSDQEMQLNILKKEIYNLDNERKMLKSQVDEKNNEMKLADEKIKLMQRDLSKVEKLLQDRVSDIKLLKNEVENLRRSEAILKSQKQNDEMLRAELNRINRQFLAEKLKSQTMEKELQKPQNIHRWRILEAEDPTRSHLISRNLRFQKDLVKMTEKLKIKEQELNDKNCEVAKLQQDLKKFAESKSEGNAWIYKKELQECKEKMKCLNAQVTMYESLSNKQQIEYKELKNEVNRLKLSAYNKKLPPIKVSE